MNNEKKNENKSFEFKDGLSFLGYCILYNNTLEKKHEISEENLKKLIETYCTTCPLLKIIHRQDRCKGCFIENKFKKLKPDCASQYGNDDNEWKNENRRKNKVSWV